jgi:CheY-like chemotaxis protein
MALEALLISRDSALLAMFRRSLEELAVKVEASSGAAAASQMMARRKFEAIVVDCDDVDGGRNVLRSLRGMPTHKNTIVFAVVGKTTTLREAFEAGANFVLEKPVALDRLVRSLRAAHPLMARERRRSFRHTIDAPVTLQLGAGPEIRARGADLSEGGLAVFTPTRLQPGNVPRFCFMLPDTAICLEGKAQVVWSQEQGHAAGLQFVMMRHDLRLELANWLASRIEQAQVVIPILAPLLEPLSASKPSRLRTDSSMLTALNL